LVRRDHRHNFSVYFLKTYLGFFNSDESSSSSSSNALPLLLKVLSSSFVPQLGVVLVTAWRYAPDLPFCLFLQTFFFVMFNTVVTAQYFVWYVAFMPLVLARSQLRLRWRGAAMLAAWFLSEVQWLQWAYQLEFLGRPTFVQLFVASCIFFVANAFVATQFIKQHVLAPFEAVVTVSASTAKQATTTEADADEEQKKKKKTN
jgi:phosphatidylinositol glycan class M